jgi:hypothetical protein
VKITRHGDSIDFAIALAPGSEDERLPLDTYATSGASWTFEMSLDTDQDTAPGGGGGADYILTPGQDRTLTITGKGQAATVPISVQPGRVAFSVPASALGDDDGLMNYLLEIYRVVPEGYERDYEVVATVAGTNNALPDQSWQVPVITDIRTEVRADTLYLRAQFMPRAPSYQTFYDPEKPGGWCLQLFLNTDQAPTGYWLGYDYIVRGVEWLPDGTFVTRRITLENGDWGPATGAARFALHQRSFDLAVPLVAIGSDDGLLDYALELYATVDCPLCSGGFGQWYIADWFGSTGLSRGRTVAAQMPRWEERLMSYGGGIAPSVGMMRGGATR